MTLRLAAAIVLAGVIVTACGSATVTFTSTPIESPEPTVSAPASAAPGIGSNGPFPLTGCPVEDEAFCAPAATLATAIVARDADAIVELSRPDVFRCDEVDASIFTGCASADVLEGHPIGTAGGPIEVFAATDYLAELDTTMAAIDPTFADAAGSGEARVLGTSACGPDDPARRSYYVAWTAALRPDGGDPERVVGLYEFTFRDDAWLVGILYIGTIAAWAESSADPLRDVGCGITPWNDG